LIISANFVKAGVPPIDITYNDGIYHIVLKGEKIKRHVKFISSDSLITNKEAHQRAKAKLTVNAGYFDPENQKSISYVVSDRNTVDDPLVNENLLRNPFLMKNLDKILNRTEFRVVECDNRKFHYEIVPHKSSVDFGCNIITSAQGGPLVYPQLRLEEEAFIVKKDGEVIRESCSVLHKTARTIIGLKGDDAHILIITDEHPMDMYEVHDYVKSLGWDRAMAFDGGSSTSMNYMNKYNVTSVGDGAGRSLKSFLIVN
ncbi:MAG TPA: phosphodiester glycosidase family protein, partial [Candidatus Stercorousia faecigallinarum]|nr:phosphodiester glycosidase family protein [Candidatus Stercorousia faecigallinarum]